MFILTIASGEEGVESTMGGDECHVAEDVIVNSSDGERGGDDGIVVRSTSCD